MVEQGHSNNLPAKELGKSKATISRWFTNDMQPSFEILFEIAKVLDIDTKELIVSIKK